MRPDAPELSCAREFSAPRFCVTETAVNFSNTLLTPNRTPLTYSFSLYSFP
jgi:hypothetical protein